jgi:hypothetical protein
MLSSPEADFGFLSSGFDFSSGKDFSKGINNHLSTPNMKLLLGRCGSIKMHEYSIGISVFSCVFNFTLNSKSNLSCILKKLIQMGNQRLRMHKA